MSENAEPPVDPVDPAGTPEAPAAPAGARRRGPRRAVRRGSEKETHWGVSTDESGGHGSNDDRLRGDVPPHW
ncbi:MULTISPECIES: hypothetical protein [unclassified Isoptericola]|uniref:hypothetical protein n=1 Tax=unclassified Isoptericola TaxID=2623355 RepID=UPI0027142D29|nr:MULTISPECIES: hypothetical protein [unclassified Isoptericola]MDO8149406.1 hypothetical protein [Isoptericola sp. b515]MDO8152353.1 hypothetical protein [Isoptericola sp. b408]